MESIDAEINGRNQQLSSDPLPFARNYQLEALEKAIKKNTIVFLETGSGKTLIAIMLLRSYGYLLRRPSPFFAVFLVPTVVLVHQQSEAIMKHTALKVGKYWGDLGVDYWDAAMWRQQVDEHEVLVMTPAILLAALRHSFLKIDLIKVLIFDECHNARGKHPYASIMTEFYHPKLKSNDSNLPRVFGMTASPIKSKGCNSDSAYWQQMHELENLMQSKIYTCVSESELAKYIPFSDTRLKYYEHMAIPCIVSKTQVITSELKMLKQKHELSLGETILSESMAEATRKRLNKIFSTLEYCLNELGIWLALKAAESFSSVRMDLFVWEKVDVRGETLVKKFCLEASNMFLAWIPSGPSWCAGANPSVDMDAGYLTSKVFCLIELLLEYREVKDLRCIIFVERIVTAIVLQTLLNELLPKVCGWRAAYTAGYNSCTQSQSRIEQNKIVEEFRNGRVNIIVATSMLEEGLDVQSCNLVVRFDLSPTVCSFIQSRGRARMQNSHFIIMLESGDTHSHNRVNKFLVSGEKMRQQSLSHASVPCAPLDEDLHMEACYSVEATGAVVNLSSSVLLLHFYCSRLPSDGYFKPTPRFVMDKDSDVCTLLLPRSCPIQTVVVQGNKANLKKLACLEACKKLHQIGALTDNLVPDMVVEEKDAQEMGGYSNYIVEQVHYVPPELVGCVGNDSETLYYCYLIELEPDFTYDIKPHGIMLALRTRLELDNETMTFDLDGDKGRLTITLRFIQDIKLASEQVLVCQRFQLTVLRVLLDRNMDKLPGVLGALGRRGGGAVFDYLLLPCAGSHQNPSINWRSVYSVQFSCGSNKHVACNSATCHGRLLHTIEGSVCSCMLENCLVVTPHNGYVYCIIGILENLDGNSLLDLKDGRSITYKAFYEQRHKLSLAHVKQPLLRGKAIASAQNYLQRSKNQKAKESAGQSSVELPPEVCRVIMSPISVSSFYSFCFAPSIMHRIESLLLAANLKKLLVDHHKENDVIPTFKVLEAVTAKECQEKFHLESLETLGDSFLKYAVSQQLFMKNPNHHEGLLSIRRQKIISNASLCKLGCDRKILGFIRNEPFDPKAWIVPGDKTGTYTLDEESLSSRKLFYGGGSKEIKSKKVADVVEALIGAFLVSGGELAALSFMEWLGIRVDFIRLPYTMPLSLSPEKLLDLNFLESLLNYTFRDPSLLVEALTHGSYMLSEIPRCFQRLEFLGDAVVDYLITKYLYSKHPGLSPGLLTDLRSASVNNDSYALAAVKAGLHKHILHASQELYRQIVIASQNFECSSSVTSFGWESDTVFPKVLGDIIESLAGAIFIDSGYDKDAVFKSIKPLLEPMITPEMLKLHPVRELSELCQKEHYVEKKPVVTNRNGKATITVEVEADGVIHKHSCSATDKKTAKRSASKAVLKSLKDSLSGRQRRINI